MSNIIKVEDQIITIRKQNVILDSDVAILYGIETRRINEAVANNLEKFPQGYVFELKSSEKQELVENFDRFNRLKHSTVLPKAFTEKGLYMLATILKSEQATKTTLEIIETFTGLRELQRTIAQLPDEVDENKQKTLMKRSGELFSELLGKDMHKAERETAIEFNLAMVKVKHSVKQKEKDLTDTTLQLKNAKELLDAGALSQDEFEKLKVKILK